jgi:hypothetical protein
METAGKVSTEKMSLEEYQKHMDALAMRLSETMRGEKLEDALSASAACIGFGMVQLPEEQHAKMREHLNRIIDVIIEKAPRQ